MKNRLDLRKAAQQNQLQLALVVAAFLIMVVFGGLYIAKLLKNQLHEEVEGVMYAAEASIRAGLSEADTLLVGTHRAIRKMIDSGASQQELLEYLRETSVWTRELQGGLIKFSGIYGYLRGEYIDGIDANPAEHFVPQRRTWYQTAIRGGTKTNYTTPYKGWVDGTMTVSAVQNVSDSDGETVGILSVNIDITQIQNYIKSLKIAEGGYGMIVSQNLVLITEPLGKDANADSSKETQLQSLNKDYREIAQALRTGDTIVGRRIIDSDGTDVIVFFRKIFNGWYIGLVTPHAQFYRDMYFGVAALSVLGLLLAAALSFVLLRIAAEKMRSDEESRSKSSFLARMSHDIRTPMNAVIGMSELALREENPPKTVELISGIKSAGQSLLTIINDILDFSKIESGKLDIVSREYLFASVINDCINIIQSRLADNAAVTLLTRIDAKLPTSFVGDEARLRQVLLNLLSNAAKYTQKGFITFGVRSEAIEGERLLVHFEVADTGVGIKADDIDKLFGDFSRVDEETNRSVQGTGLGLAIARNLCRLMGGDIQVDSVYGNGSVFTASIPQEIRNSTPFAAVKVPETKMVAIYETESSYSGALSYSVESLGVACRVAARLGELSEILRKKPSMAHLFVLVRQPLFENARVLIEQSGVGEGVTLTLLVQGEYISQECGRTIIMPINPLSIARLLNGEIGATVSAERKDTIVRFIAPSARVLIVDDVPTNLVVAEGLMSPYHMVINTCASGKEAIALATEHKYDIIFMDHMMPEMDGIEATAAIRALKGDISQTTYYRSVPIVALTANAISGMKEMFLQKGFSDYLAKPIEMSKLDEIISKWIPKEKRLRSDEVAPTPVKPAGSYDQLVKIGVDTKRGIEMTGGSETGYEKILRSFSKDALERLSLFDHTPTTDELPLFAVNAHALKSAAATIGANALSELAAKLETAGKAGDMQAINRTITQFHNDLAKLSKTIADMLTEKSDAQTETVAIGDHSAVFNDLLSALTSEDIGAIRTLLNDLENQPFDQPTKELLNQISTAVLMTEFEEAIRAIDKLITSSKQ
ncbi:hypothetical protein AGMMS50229_03840 [Campylobacterota bacterium]|nr:hypothetical protein AGMMS50229_03840 [Campylobacterota bacterium]